MLAPQMLRDEAHDGIRTSNCRKIPGSTLAMSFGKSQTLIEQRVADPPPKPAMVLSANGHYQ